MPSDVLDVVHTLGEQQCAGGLILLRPGEGFVHRHAHLLLHLRDGIAPGVADLRIKGVVRAERVDRQPADPTVEDPFAGLRPWAWMPAKVPAQARPATG